MSDVKTIAGAINDMSESDLAEATASDESGASEDVAEETPDKDTDEAETGENKDEKGEEGEEVEEEEEEEEDTETGDDDEELTLEDLTPEQLKAIKANPETNTLYKSLMRATTKKWQRASEAIRLIDAYNRDPKGVARAIAEANGLSISQATAAAAEAKVDAVESAAQELEGLFGEKYGPKVRATLEKFIDARTGKAVGPIQNTLGQVVNQGEQARMMSEEQSFKMRHRKVLTPSLEAAVVKLGESGMIVPGRNATPGQYLDTLLRVALADEVLKQSGSEKRTASVRLAKKIDKNRREREPGGVSGRAPVEKVSKIKPGMSFSDAFDMAAKELDEEAS